ncbi:MAG: 50S ribosomal protein L37ae [Candidatus Thermoplasmatota archaeon]|nr:50S ribosomal protein L37ae [Candidatus Thermoplasmatota archaeon]
MSKRTKKVGTSGRLGPRYGVRVRKRIADIEAVSKGRHECPVCHGVALGRSATGIWICRHCGAKMASSSYMPTPPAAVRREVAEVLAKAEGKEEAVEPKDEEAEDAVVEEPVKAEKAEKPKKKAKKKE